MRYAPGATTHALHPDITDIRDFIADRLPLSGHLGGILETWDWDPEVIADRCTQVRIDDELVGLYLRGRVLRAVGSPSVIGPGLHDQIGHATRTVMGPREAVADLAHHLDVMPPRIVDVWGIATAASPAEHVRVPTSDEIPAFAYASFVSYAEEIGTAPTTHPEDSDYLNLWHRLALRGRIVGVWHHDRCVFRAEIRPFVDLTVELRGVWLAPEERGHGRAQAYLTDALSYVGRNFSPTAHVLVSRENRQAVRLYERVGMTHSGALGRLDTQAHEPTRRAS